MIKTHYMIFQVFIYDHFTDYGLQLKPLSQNLRKLQYYMKLVKQVF